MPRRLLLILLTLGVLIVLALSWKPEPYLKNLPFLPASFLQWADRQENGNIRTAIPFAVLGLLAGTWLALQRAPWRHWGWILVAGIGLLLLSETGQWFLPHRHADLGDIGWGSLGLLAGMGLPAIVYVVFTKRQRG